MDNLPRRGAFVVGVCIAMAALTSPALRAEPALADGALGSGIQDTVWKDVDGRPLPFQSDEEILEFLRTAEIESMEGISVGVTDPRQVVLERGGVRMRAVLRDYDETFEETRIDGVFYTRLRDSYVFDTAAYELARLLGLDAIPPVVLRRVGGSEVSLQAWVEDGVMETDRAAQGTPPPSVMRYRQQMQNMRVFDSIVGNVDRNTGNILTDPDGNFWLIDHSRSFVRNDETPYLEGISMCGRRLFERIKTLTREELAPLMSPPLTDSEIDWTLLRRDKVVAHIERLLETRPAGTVLFDDER